MLNLHVIKFVYDYMKCFGIFQYPHLPEFEGDDLRRLGQEIALARKFLAQARQYR